MLGLRSERTTSFWITYTKISNLNPGLEIRDISLFPGKNTDPLYYTIANLNLQDNPVYEADSYTWATEGDDSKSARVHCEGAVIPVTSNFEAALRKLRLLSKERLLWIDSSSINQGYLRERNHQFSLMDRVNKSASSVQLCIHDPTRDYSTCMCWLQTGRDYNETAVAQTK